MSMLKKTQTMEANISNSLGVVHFLIFRFIKFNNFHILMQSEHMV